MNNTFTVAGDYPYHQTEPRNPTEHMLWSTDEDDYIKVYTWVSGEWNLVIGMKPLPDKSVEITYSPDGEEASEEIELLDYQYRIGVL